MKNTVLFIYFTFVLNLVTNSQIFHEDFLTNHLYKVTLGGEGNDGKNDYFQRVTSDSISISYTGTDSIFFAGQDIDDGGWAGSDSPSQLTWSGIDIKGMVLLRFEGLFAEVQDGDGEIDKTDFLLMQYRVDDNEWENLLLFANDGSTYNTIFLEDTDFDGIGDGTAISSPEGKMVTITKEFLVWGDSLALRFTAAVNSGGEDFAIDEFKLFDIPSTAARNLSKEAACTITLLNQKLLINGEGLQSIEVYTLSGKKVIVRNCRVPPLMFRD